MEYKDLRDRVNEAEKYLESLHIEKAELEKLIHNFDHRHATELGSIILTILELKALKVKNDQAKFREAETETEHYRSQIDNRISIKYLEISDLEKEELKRKFRKASLLCHPDKVADDFKDAARGVFIDLKHAYDTNDLSKVSEILTHLQDKTWLKPNIQSLSGKDFIISELERIRSQIKIVEAEILILKQNPSYLTASNINDIDGYFRRTKQKLLFELDQLRSELSINNPPI